MLPSRAPSLVVNALRNVLLFHWLGSRMVAVEFVEVGGRGLLTRVWS